MHSNKKIAVATKENLAKYTIKDSVFSDLFKEKKYLLQLYQTLHPEDVEATAEDIQNITIKNVLIDDLYNDLGFQMRDQLIILVEAQSTWSSNIIIRAFLYLAYSYKDYFDRTGQSLYTSTKVHLPKPELYVIYTGERKKRPEVISFSEEYFAGETIALDVKIRVIYEKDTDDIINQYILFSKIYNINKEKYGRSKRSITETIRICKDNDILREYLENREKEVISIMMPLFDDEEIWKAYKRNIERETQEKIQHATNEMTKNMVFRMLESGKMSLKEIAGYADLSLWEVERLNREYRKQKKE